MEKAALLHHVRAFLTLQRAIAKHLNFNIKNTTVDFFLYLLSMTHIIAENLLSPDQKLTSGNVSKDRHCQLTVCNEMLTDFKLA